MKAKRALALLLSVALAAAVPVGALASDDSDSAGAAATAEEASDPCADGHKYEKTAVEEPTCTDKGTVTYTCSVCGDEYTEDGEDATGHDYNDGEVTKEPTEDSEGVKTFTCKNCGASYTEAIPKLEKKEKEEKSGKKSSDKDKGDDKDSSSGNTKPSEKSNSSQTGGKGSGNVIDEEEDLKNAAGNGKEEAELLPLWFAGRQVTKADCKDIMGDKSVSYDEASRTLTLNNANYAFTFKDSDDTPAALIVYSCKDKGKTDLTIQLKGENILSASAKKDLRSIIRVENGSLFIKGTGSLFIKGTDEEAALYAKEDIVLFKDAKDDDDAGSLTVDAKTAGLIAGENISVKAGTLSVAAVDKDKDEDDEDRYGTALLAGKDLSVSKDLEIAVPASGKTFTDKKKKLATIVEKGETTPAAKVLIQEPEEDNSKSKNKNVTEEKKDDDGQEIEDSEPAGEEDSAGKKNSSEQEINESEPAGEEDSAEKKFATGTNLQGTEYPISVNGTKVTDVNKDNIDGSGTIYYDPSTNTLTLDEYSEKYAPETAQTSLDSFISYTGTTDLNIEIKETCSIKALKAESANSYKSVIRSEDENASLILKGSGSLTIESKEADAALYSGKNIVLFENGDKGMLEVKSKITAIKAKGNITLPSGIKIADQVNGKIGKSSDNSFTSIFEKGKKDPDPCNYVLIVPTDATAYTVTFQPHGGKGSMDPVKVSAGPDGDVKYTLPENGFTPPQCYVFGRWKIGTDKYYYAGAEISLTEDITVNATWKHLSDNLELQKEVPATCTEDGTKAHYKCSVCGRLYEKIKNGYGESATTEEKIVITKTGHKYGTPTYAWAKDYSKVTAKRVCANNSEHVETETVSTKKTVVNPTCEKAGKTTYTATFENKAFATQPKVITKKALGHNWSATWKWNSDSTKASLTLVCKNNAKHTVTASEEDVHVTGKITMPASSTSNGKVVRTATVTFNKDFRDTHPDFKYTDLYDKALSGHTQLVIKPAGKTGYKFVTSAGKANPTYSWTRGGKTSLLFIVKRNEYDAITFPAYVKVTVGGKAVPKSEIETAEGSLKFTLSSKFLNTLSVPSGTNKTKQHVVKVFFKDGTAETKITVKGSSSSNNSSRNTSRTSTNSRGATRTSTSTNPRTGDATNWITWLVLAAGSAAVLAIILFVRKRGGKKE